MGKIGPVHIGSFLVGILAGYLVRHYLAGRAKATA